MARPAWHAGRTAVTLAADGGRRLSTSRMGAKLARATTSVGRTESLLSAVATAAGHLPTDARLAIQVAPLEGSPLVGPHGAGDGGHRLRCRLGPISSIGIVTGRGGDRRGEVRRSEAKRAIMQTKVLGLQHGYVTP